MARLFTSGFEVNQQLVTPADVDPKRGGGGSPGCNTQTATVRSGTYAGICDVTGVTGTAYFIVSLTSVVSTTYYVRAYINLAGLPAARVHILTMDSGGSSDAGINLETDGTLTLRNLAGTQIGSASPALATGAWYRIEFSLTTDASNHGSATEFRLDGVSIASGSLTGSVIFDSLRIGFSDSPTNLISMRVDDLAINDSTGTAQNTWPGEGRVVLLVPISDNAKGTGWTNDAATTTNLWDAVNNLHPAGVADTTTGTGLQQLRNATANANVNYDANMTSFATAGLKGSDVVTVIDPIVSTGAPVVTSAKAGTVGVVSNPAIANVSLGAGGTAGAFWSGVAAGAWNTGWKTSHGTIVYAPAVVLATSPVMRITQVTSSTQVAMVSFIGMYVEYISRPPAKPVAVLQAVQRAASRFSVYRRKIVPRLWLPGEAVI